jgi:putative serine protease PepD
MSDRDATGFGAASGEGDDDDALDIPPDDHGGRPLDALPDPMDRLWMHPSELAALPPAAPSTPARARPMWTATVMAGAAGAILTLGVLGALGVLDRPAADRSAGAVVPTSTPVATAQAVVLAVAHSVVAVSAHDGRETRRGSGVTVRRAGEILTSERLIGGAEQIEVTTSDGEVHAARVVGRDRTTDLVLLRLVSDGDTAAEPVTLKRSATFASSTPKTGDSVWVVGAPSPGGTSPWLSTGLVASTDSMVAVEGGPTTSGLLETGAASNTASSGAALVDKSGKVTGIVLAPVSGKRMTYAVPIDTALSIAEDLREQGFTTHGALGIDGTNTPEGPTVTRIDPDGPAAAAGVRVGDIVESVDEHEVDSMTDVVALVRHDRPGESIVLGLRRGTERLKVLAQLTSLVTP